MPDPTKPPNERPEHLDYLLTAYLFENISAAGRAEVESHLLTCAACRAQLDELRATLGIAQTALDEHGRAYVFEKRRKQRVIEAAKAMRHGVFSRLVVGGFGAWQFKLAAVAAMVVVALLFLASIFTNNVRNAYVSKSTRDRFDTMMELEKSRNVEQPKEEAARSTLKSVEEASPLVTLSPPNKPGNPPEERDLKSVSGADGTLVYRPGYQDDYTEKDAKFLRGTSESKPALKTPEKPAENLAFKSKEPYGLYDTNGMRDREALLKRADEATKGVITHATEGQIVLSTNTPTTPPKPPDAKGRNDSPQSGWSAHAASDNKDPDAGDFAVQADDIAKSKHDLAWQKDYLGGKTPDPKDAQVKDWTGDTVFLQSTATFTWSDKDAPAKAANGGADLLLYNGHGNAKTLGGDQAPKIVNGSDAELMRQLMGRTNAMEAKNAELERRGFSTKLPNEAVDEAIAKEEKAAPANVTGSQAVTLGGFVDDSYQLKVKNAADKININASDNLGQVLGEFTKSAGAPVTEGEANGKLSVGGLVQVRGYNADKNDPAQKKDVAISAKDDTVKREEQVIAYAEQQKAQADAQAQQAAALARQNNDLAMKQAEVMSQNVRTEIESGERTARLQKDLDYVRGQLGDSKAVLNDRVEYKGARGETQLSVTGDNSFNSTLQFGTAANSTVTAPSTATGALSSAYGPVVVNGSSTSGTVVKNGTISGTITPDEKAVATPPLTIVAGVQSNWANSNTFTLSGVNASGSGSVTLGNANGAQNPPHFQTDTERLMSGVFGKTEPPPAVTSAATAGTNLAGYAYTPPPVAAPKVVDAPPAKLAESPSGGAVAPLTTLPEAVVPKAYAVKPDSNLPVAHDPAKPADYGLFAAGGGPGQTPPGVAAENAKAEGKKIPIQQFGNVVTDGMQIVADELDRNEKIDPIVVRGNNKTKDKVIIRQMELAPGERVDTDKLKIAASRLKNLQHSEDDVAAAVKVPGDVAAKAEGGDHFGTLSLNAPEKPAGSLDMDWVLDDGNKRDMFTITKNVAVMDNAAPEATTADNNAPKATPETQIAGGGGGGGGFGGGRNGANRNGFGRGEKNGAPVADKKSESKESESARTGKKPNDAAVPDVVANSFNAPFQFFPNSGGDAGYKIKPAEGSYQFSLSANDGVELGNKYGPDAVAKEKGRNKFGIAEDPNAFPFDVSQGISKSVLGDLSVGEASRKAVDSQTNTVVPSIDIFSLKNAVSNGGGFSELKKDGTATVVADPKLALGSMGFNGLDPNVLFGDAGDLKRLGAPNYYIRPRVPGSGDTSPGNLPFPGFVNGPDQVNSAALNEVGTIVNNFTNFFPNDAEKPAITGSRLSGYFMAPDSAITETIPPANETRTRKLGVTPNSATWESIPKEFTTAPQRESDRRRPEDDSKLNKALDSARVEFQSGSNEQALKQVEQVLALDPGNAEAAAIKARLQDKSIDSQWRFFALRNGELPAEGVALGTAGISGKDATAKNSEMDADGKIAEYARERTDKARLLETDEHATAPTYRWPTERPRTPSRDDIPHSDYLIYPDDWRQIARRTAEGSGGKSPEFQYAPIAAGGPGDTDAPKLDKRKSVNDRIEAMRQEQLGREQGGQNPQPILLSHPRLDPNFPTLKAPDAPVAQFVPPVYKTEERKICVEPEKAIKHPAPAIFETRTRQVVVEPERRIAHPVPGVFKDEEYKVQINADKPNELAVFETRTRKVGVTAESVTYETIPPVYKTEEYKVCVKPESCTTETIPGVFETREVQVCVKPAEWRFNSPTTEELYLRSYRFFHAENPKLDFAQFLRRPDSIRPAPLSDDGLDEDLYIDKFGTRPFVDCARDHLSTFSLDVDTAAYTLARAALREGKLPAPESVKVEEFLNYFKQDYAVQGGEAFGVFAEAATTPFLDATQLVRDSYAAASDPRTRELLRIGIKSRDPRPNERKPSMLTFVIDTSGSMSHAASMQYAGSRLHLVKDALKDLVESLNAEDAIGIVGFGDQAELILPPTQARQKPRILEAIDGMTAGGATNVEAGLNLGFRLADEAFALNGVNRMILCSDGVANLGAKGPEEILKTVKLFAQRGISISTVGVGRGQVNDPLLRKLADEGDGSCHYADSLDEAKKIFAEKLPPHLNVLAKDAKVQVDFNVDTIKSYRLLGYEKRKIADKDFRNDKVDAGEVAHSTLITVFYELVRQPGSHGALGKVYLRWKDAGSPRLEVIERNYPLDESICAGPAQNASSDFRFLACVGRFAELLRESPWTRHGSYAEVLTELDALPADYKTKPAWSEVRDLVTRAMQLSVAKWKGEM